MQRRYKMFVLIILSLGVVFVYYRLQRMDRQQSDIDAYAQRVAAIAEPLCQVIAPHVGVLSVEPVINAHPFQSHWVAECGTLENGRLREAAVLFINPKTNELERIGLTLGGEVFVRSSGSVSGQSQQEVNQELTALARRWLIRFDTAGKEWKLVSGERTNAGYVTYWQTDRRRAMLVIGGSDRGLRSIIIRTRRE